MTLRRGTLPSSRFKRRRLLTVVSIGWMDEKPKQIPHCIDENVSFSTGNALASVLPPTSADVGGLHALTVNDYTSPFPLPNLTEDAERTVVYFPGSTIGNFDRAEAIAFMQQMAETAGPGGGLLIGVDLRKDPAILRAAYNDREGVTAAFNLNLLRRMNRELGADFDVDAFRHEAIWREDPGRMEMHLVSTRDQNVQIGDETIVFEKGETIHTENSCKFSLDEFSAMAQKAGFDIRTVWTDADELFSVQYAEVSAA